MPVVTAIVSAARKDGRFEVQVEGKPFATVSLDMLERLSLRVGEVLDDARTVALERDAAALQTYDRAINMLAFQARSSRDLRRRLVQKGEEPSLVDEAIGRLTAGGFLDDAQFARQLARSKLLGAGASKRRLQQELFKRGVERTTADEAIAEVTADEDVDEDAMVREVAAKKLRSLSRDDDATRRRKLYAFLARRGHDGDVIRRAMTAVLSGVPESLDGEEGEVSTGEES